MSKNQPNDLSRQSGKSPLERSIICLRCPLGCEVRTKIDESGNVLETEGKICKLGKEYVQAEVKDPRRVLCSTVRVRGGAKPLVSVWTPKPIPKDQLLVLAKDTREIELEAPVHVGQPVITNWRGLGLDVIASGEVEKIS